MTGTERVVWSTPNGNCVSQLPLPFLGLAASLDLHALGENIDYIYRVTVHAHSSDFLTGETQQEHRQSTPACEC
jgi:hypothetical protein